MKPSVSPQVYLGSTRHTRKQGTRERQGRLHFLMMEVCCAQVTDGYIVTETDLRIDEFEASAECAPGWTGRNAIEHRYFTSH